MKASTEIKILIAAVIVSCALLTFVVNMPVKNGRKLATASVKAEQVGQLSKEEYVIGTYQDKIAVFSGESSIPFEVFDVYVNTLPESDRERLREGIKVSGKDNLRILIEDYTS